MSSLIFDPESKNIDYLTIGNYVFAIVDSYIDTSMLIKIGNKHRAINGLNTIRIDTIKSRADVAEFSNIVASKFEKPGFITTGLGKGRTVWALYPIALKIFFIYSPVHESEFIQSAIDKNEIVTSSKPESFKNFSSYEEAINFRFDRSKIGEVFSVIGEEITRRMKLHGKTFQEIETVIQKQILNDVNNLTIKDIPSLVLSLRSIE